MNHLLRKIDLTSLRLFVAVCQEKNIARAAEREAIAPSAVSRRIADIEAAIGLPVLERQSRGVAVTPAGETVLRHALAMIGNMEAMSVELSHFSSGVKGDVRLVASLSSIVQFLPQDIARFQRIYPDVNISIEEENSSDILRSVDERTADFGIGVHAPGIERFDCRPYRIDRLGLLVPRGHALHLRSEVNYAEILAETYVGSHRDSALAALLEKEAARLESTLKVKIRVMSLDALCRMVHAGLGVAIVPRQVAELYLEALDLRFLALNDPWARRQVMIVSKTASPLSAPAATLVDFLAASDDDRPAQASFSH